MARNSLAVEKGDLCIELRLQHHRELDLGLPAPAMPTIAVAADELLGSVRPRWSRGVGLPQADAGLTIIPYKEFDTRILQGKLDGGRISFVIGGS